MRATRRAACDVCLPPQSHSVCCSYFRGLHEVSATEDASSVLCEHVDAQDSGGSWYQAFIIYRDDSKIRVHFNGWASNVTPRPRSTKHYLSHSPIHHSMTRTSQP